MNLITAKAQRRKDSAKEFMEFLFIFSLRFFAP
jgi:hypothetical protein